MPSVTPGLVLDIGLPAAALVGWFALYGFCLLVTRPREVQPYPPTQDLGGPQSPALVSLLANGWEITEDAAEATLVDLGARRYLEFRQPANDPMQTTIHVRRSDGSELAAYEKRVLDRVCGLAHGDVVPLTALTFRDPEQAKNWGKRLRAEVVAEARSQGLSRRRLSSGVVTMLTTAALGVGLAVFVALMHRGADDENNPAFGGGALAFIALATLAARSHGERDTAAGREVASRWLGLKAYLRGDESFAELPPSAVAVWDRYLSYGVAVGAARVCSAVIDLGMGSRRRVWSSFGGSWHRVRVRYPRLWPRYGKPVPPVVIRALLSAALGALLLRYWYPLIRDLAAMDNLEPNPVAGVAGLVETVGVLAGLGLLGYGMYALVRTVLDVTSPAEVTGEVLWKQVWRTNPGGENSPPRPWLYHLAVDDGRSDRTVAWGLPVQLAGSCEVGDVIRFSVRPWTRRIGQVTVVEAGRARRLAAADTRYGDADNTENLIAVAMGLPAQHGAGAVAQAVRAPEVSAGQLVTAEEVSRVLGRPVAARGLDRTRGPLSVEMFHTVPDDRRALYLATVSGPPAKLAMATRRVGQPLPGIGDEAYAGDGWATGRRGSAVVLLQLHSGAGPVDPRNLHWLLSVAVGRLPGQARHPASS